MKDDLDDFEKGKKAAHGREYWCLIENESPADNENRPSYSNYQSLENREKCMFGYANTRPP